MGLRTLQLWFLEGRGQNTPCAPLMGAQTFYGRGLKPNFECLEGSAHPPGHVWGCPYTLVDIYLCAADFGKSVSSSLTTFNTEFRNKWYLILKPEYCSIRFTNEIGREFTWKLPHPSVLKNHHVWEIVKYFPRCADTPDLIFAFKQVVLGLSIEVHNSFLAQRT